MKKVKNLLKFFLAKETPQFYHKISEGSGAL